MQTMLNNAVLDEKIERSRGIRKQIMDGVERQSMESAKLDDIQADLRAHDRSRRLSMGFL
jgi:hypothetical protein